VWRNARDRFVDLGAATIRPHRERRVDDDGRPQYEFPVVVATGLDATGDHQEKRF
jgi:hypothetical protein